MGSKKVLLVLITIAILLKIGVILFTYQNYGRNVYVGHYARDLDCWFDMFSKIEKGMIPLVDFPKEYSGGAILLNWGLSFFYSSPHQFILVYGFFMFLIDMATAVVLWKILRLEKRGNAYVILALYLFLPTILILNHVRWDIVPVFFAILAYYYWRKGKIAVPAILLGIGASMKWFPAFLVIGFFLNEVFIKRRFRKGAGQVFISLATFVAMEVPFLLLNRLRGNDLSNWTGSYTVNYSFRTGADTLPGIIQILSDIRFSSGFLFGISLVFFLLVVLLHSKRNVPSNYVLYCLSFLLFNKIYSPQFHIWFVPFLLLCLPDKGYWRFWNKGPELGIPAILAFEIVNMLVYPFSFTWFLQDAGSFTYAPFLSVKIFSSAIILRAFLILWIGWGLWKKH